MIKKKIYFLLCLLFIGCFNNIFHSDIPKLLNLKEEKLEYENIYSIESVAGITGEGAIFEIYSLSDKTVTMFLKNNIKILPEKEYYNKINWEQGTCTFRNSLERFVNYIGNKKLEEQLRKLRELLCQSSIYTALYFNGNTIESSLGIQLMVLDIKNKKIYIYEIDI